MYQTIKKIYILLFVFGSISCSKSMDEIPAGTENVNGFNVEWRKNVAEAKKDVIRDILNDMVFVEGGLFLMGATQEQEPFARQNEKPAHYVQLSDYYIEKKEPTIEQLEILLDTEFSPFENMRGTPDFTWDDWKLIMQIIYEYSNINIDFPTEAQWEYAARGGIYSKGYIYSGANTIEEAEVGENELGLLDMVKNHSEWCKDAYNEYSHFPLEDNPLYIQGVGHVVRGGNIKSISEQNDYTDDEFYNTRSKFSWSYDDYRTCRVSSRSYCDVQQSFLNTYITCRFVININE